MRGELADRGPAARIIGLAKANAFVSSLYLFKKDAGTTSGKWGQPLDSRSDPRGPTAHPEVTSNGRPLYLFTGGTWISWDPVTLGRDAGHSFVDEADDHRALADRGRAALH
jgi:hypothetical protein